MNRHDSLVASVLLLLLASSALAGWTPPTVVGPPISTPYQDYSAYVTQDGKTMYFSSDRPGTMGDRDLWVSQKVGGVWQTPVNLGSAINSSYEEHDPMVDESGSLLFFSSSRPSPYGGWWPWHLYVSHKVNGVWQPAQDIGAPVNSSCGEECPFLWISHPDTFLYFASYCRTGGQGQWDIWVSHRANGIWETPVNLGVPVNSGNLDAAPFFTKHIGDRDAIGCEKVMLYFTSMRPGGSGHIDLWRVLRKDNIWQTPENLGSFVNWGYRSDRPCFIDDDKDNEDAILYFSDDGRSGGIGSWDIWLTYQEDTDDPSVASMMPKDAARPSLNVHPNPFAAETRIRYCAPIGTPLSVKVYAVSGRLVKTLADGTGDGKMRNLTWKGLSEDGRSLPNGPYFVKMNCGGSFTTTRIMLVR